MRKPLLLWSCVLGGLMAACSLHSQGLFDFYTNSLTFLDGSGQFATVTTAKHFDQNNPFFQDIGTNGRSCVTCHAPSDGWSVVPSHIQARFLLSGGNDPLFRPNDGSVCPDSDVSTPKKRLSAYSLLLKKGLFRIQRELPLDAEFSVTAVDDPYGCTFSPSTLSVYRRVLPATNLRFVQTVMWDARETFTGQTLESNLEHQALDATLGHAQGSVMPTDLQLQQIVAFELATYTAQTRDARAGDLTAAGGQGGPAALSKQPFTAGENSPGPGFNPAIFSLYTNFGAAGDRSSKQAAAEAEAQAAITRGQTFFNTRRFTISGVAGLPPSIVGTCGSCHNSMNAGGHSSMEVVNVGVADASRRTADLPLFTLFCATTGETVQTTDPGNALTTGKCADIGKFKDPVLRGLAARAPYFHNGSAATLMDVVDFYDQRFTIGLSGQDKSDLIAFLNTL